MIIELVGEIHCPEYQAWYSGSVSTVVEKNMIGFKNTTDIEADERQGRSGKKLSDLTSDHRRLDDEISERLKSSPFDQLKIQRLKKRKLALKDAIINIKSQLLPDIIA